MLLLRARAADEVDLRFMCVNMPRLDDESNSRGPSLKRKSLPGPLERMRVQIPVVDVPVDRQLEVLDAVKVAQLEALLMQERKPDLNLIEPRCVRGREVNLEPIPVSPIPGDHVLAGMGVQVVQDQMYAPSRVQVSDAIEVSEKVRLLSRGIAPAENTTRAYVETREQARGTVTDVLEFESSRLADSRAKSRRCSLNSLDAGLFVD